MHLPVPRGPISQFLIEALAGGPHDLSRGPSLDADVLLSDDFQLALYVCYELHYRGFDDVSDAWEWEPSVISYRNSLESAFMTALSEKVPLRSIAAAEVEDELKALVAREQGPSLSRYLEKEASLGRFQEFVAHRSIYHLREADPHTWVIPRLFGPPKAALVEVQADEYGGGNPERMHSTLYAGMMRSLDLDPSYGAYLDRVPGTTLATVNLMSTFGLHRSRRGMAVGHLAVLEMDSSIPNRRYSEGLNRLGLPGSARRFYDEHVEADSVHEAIAAHDLAGALAQQEPEIAADIVFGAEALVFVEGYFAETLLSAWDRGESSLLLPLA